MKILLIDQTSSFLDFALRCEAEGHEVRVFMGPTKRGERSTVGDGLLNKVKDWQPSMKWADLITYSDNNKYITALEPYRKEGYPIFGPNIEVTKWEVERGVGQKVLEDCGVKCMDSIEFTDYDKAAEHVRKTMKRYVSKPCADANKALSYVSKGPADMIFMLDYWKKRGKIKSPFLLQEFTAGIEMAVGGWFGLNGFSNYFLENFEFKKLMNGEVGVNCYSADTEVLTESGWKFWPNIVDTDKICTLIDGEIEFETPSRLTVADVDEDLISWQSNTVDIMVTAGHQMYVQDAHGRNPFYFESADICATKKRSIKRSGGAWCGQDDISKIPNFCKSGMPEWAAFLGAYIADGSTKQRSLVFGNCPLHKQIYFIEIAAAAGFEAKMYGKDLYVNGKEITKYMGQFGHALDKFCPDYIKQGSIETIQAFLYGYGIGDGSTRQNNTTYTTISKRLADDLQELLLKAGRYGSISIRDRRGESHYINGYLCEKKHVEYDIYENSVRLKANLSPEICEKIPYKGKVYCCTVTSHIIYVRRNGKACWLGQTGEMGTVMKYVPLEESKLAQMVLKPLEGALFRSGYTGYIDVAVIVDDKGNPLPLEHTTRKSWPAFQIQQALHPDIATWMLDSINGRDTLQPDTRIAVGVVVAIPDFPYSEMINKDVSDFPVWGMTVKNRYNIHPAEMKMGSAPVEKDGKIVNESMLVTAGDYVLIVSGVGDTVDKAKEECYNTLKELEIPNSPMYRTDIGCRLEKQLPELQKLGFATSWKY